MSDEQALKLLLASWRAPAAPDALRARVVNSYRQELQQSVAGEGEEMKRCPMCHAEFAPQFRFCPVDGLPLVVGIEARPAADTLAQLEQASSERLHAPVATLMDVHEFDDSVAIESRPPEDAGTVTATRVNARTRAEYQLTLLAEASLYARLTTELRAAGRESQLTWPELKRDPIGFARRTVAGYGLLLRRVAAQEHVAQACVAALVVILSLVGAVVALDRYHRAQRSALARVAESEYEVVGWANAIPNEPKQEEGPAGMAARGTGGGSLANKERPGGGGGGGRHEALPASSGKLPPATWQPQLQAPDPKPPVVQNAQLPTVTTLQGDPVLFPPDPRPLPYGDPKSQATDPSSGAGDGNGIGDGHGGGVGTGDGNGYGPGRDGNTGGGPMKPGGGGPGCCGGTTDYANKTFTVRDVTKRAVITSKPEPQFTEEARRNGVTGEVMLRMVLSASGQVTGIVPLKRLPDGLTEKAIAAARSIQFIPAEKDGHKVSQYVTVSYNFNIY